MYFMQNYHPYKGGAGIIHVIRNLPNIFNVNCDLHFFFLRETWLGVPPWNVMCHLLSAWSVIKAPFSTWKLYKCHKIYI